MTKQRINGSMGQCDMSHKWTQRTYFTPVCRDNKSRSGPHRNCLSPALDFCSFQGRCVTCRAGGKSSNCMGCGTNCTRLAHASDPNEKRKFCSFFTGLPWLKNQDSINNRGYQRLRLNSAESLSIALIVTTLGLSVGAVNKVIKYAPKWPVKAPLSPWRGARARQGTRERKSRIVFRNDGSGEING